MVARSARTREQLALATSMRTSGRSWSEIAGALRDRYGLGARIAMRVAHGWTQAEIRTAVVQPLARRPQDVQEHLLVLDPTGRSMTGRRLGPDRHVEIDSGRWELHRAE